MKKRQENLSDRITQWIGSTASLIAHTVFFVGIFVLRFFGFSSSDIFLILTTIVSLEAIYLAIFIQITINQHGEELDDVSEDIEELQEDFEEIQEDLDDDEVTDISRFEYIEHKLQTLLNEIESLKKKDENNK